MIAPATIQDLLDLRTARRADGKLVHRNCGGQVVWAIFSDKAACRGCQQSWERLFLVESQKKLGKSGYFQFIPEVDLVTSDEEDRKAARPVIKLSDGVDRTYDINWLWPDDKAG